MNRRRQRWRSRRLLVLAGQRGQHQPNHLQAVRRIQRASQLQRVHPAAQRTEERRRRKEEKKKERREIRRDGQPTSNTNPSESILSWRNIEFMRDSGSASYLADIWEKKTEEKKQELRHAAPSCTLSSNIFFFVFSDRQAEEQQCQSVQVSFLAQTRQAYG